MQAIKTIVAAAAIAVLGGCGKSEKKEAAAVTPAPVGPAAAMPAGMSLGEPLVHANLAVFPVRGPSVDGREYITLDEGLRDGTVIVREKGSAQGQDRAEVNDLEIDNSSDRWLFLQSGDMVKGGKQDRTIASDIALAPRSGPRPLAAFCVEHGRWTAGKGGLQFAENSAIVSGNDLKLAIQAKASQTAVWSEVARAESRAAAGRAPLPASAASATVGAERSPVSNAAPPPALSTTGTYNAIVEDSKVREEREAYVAALLEKVSKDPEAIGMVVAVNGEVVAADVYGSRALFRKLVRKLVESYALQATLEKDPAKAGGQAPAAEAARSFLADLQGAAEKGESRTGTMHRRTRENERAVLFEYTDAAADAAPQATAAPLHRSYLKK